MTAPIQLIDLVSLRICPACNGSGCRACCGRGRVPLDPYRPGGGEGGDDFSDLPPNLCSRQGCDRISRARGMCSKHYYEWKAQTPLAGAVGAWPVAARIGWSTGPREEDGCRVWLGCFGEDGYPIIKVDGKERRVTRIIVGLDSGDPRVAMHSCDTPACVEPTHLRAATAAENDADRATKGRAARFPGEAHPGAKLTAEQARSIRARAEAGEPVVDLVGEFGVSRSQVYRIVSGDRWASLVDPPEFDEARKGREQEEAGHG